MFWPHAVVLFLLSAGPIWIPAGWTHRWTQWGSACILADTPTLPSDQDPRRMAAHHTVTSGGLLIYPLAMK